MEPIKSVEMIDVVAISDSGKKEELFRLAADTTISELKRLWEAEHELPEGSLVRKTDGSLLEGGEKISEIEEVSPGSKTVTVLIEKAIDIRVGVYKCSAEDMRSISVELGATPEDCEGKAAAVEGEAKAGERRERIGEESQAAAAVAGGGEVTDSSFFVGNYCFDFNNRKDFSVVLRLPGRPTVGDVRRAIAHHMRRPPSTTELRRWVGRTKSGEEVFDVGRYFPLVLADVSGGEKDGSDVEVEHKTLHDDDQPFPVVAGHENHFYVDPR